MSNDSYSLECVPKREYLEVLEVLFRMENKSNSTSLYGKPLQRNFVSNNLL